MSPTPPTSSRPDGGSEAHHRPPAGTLRRRLPRPLLLLLVLVAAVAASLAAPLRPATAVGAAPCAVAWGSLPDLDSRATASTIVDVRAGRHTCFDRVVIELRGTGRPGFDVRYVSQVHEDGSGRLVPLRGAAKLQVVAFAPAYDVFGRPTYRPADRAELVPVAGYTTLRQVASAGSFEGQTTFGLGLRARLPFRTTVLPATATTGTRLVIDVAHRWS